MAARQEVEKAKEAVINAEGNLALEEEEVLKGEARLLALQYEVNHTSTPDPTMPQVMPNSQRVVRGSRTGLSQRLHQIW